MKAKDIFIFFFNLFCDLTENEEFFNIFRDCNRCCLRYFSNKLRARLTRLYRLTIYTICSNIIAIQPGKEQTMGAPVGVFGTVRPLSFEDVEALERLPTIDVVVPVSGGSGEIESDTRMRRSMVVGTGSDYDIIVDPDGKTLGKYLPDDNPKTPRAFAVLGPKMKDELFGDKNPLGLTIRVNSIRFRVIGVLPPKGDF